MAREMALAGVDRSELTPPPPMKQPSTFREKLSNFWFHYKAIVIASVVALGFGGWLLYQTLTDDPVDYSVVVVTEETLYATEIEAMKTYLAAHGEDLDGDGNVEIEVESLIPNYYDELAPSVGKADNDKLQTYLVTGEKMLFVFDEVSYDGFMTTIDGVTEADYAFFAPLDVQSADYNTEEHYWNWCSDVRRTELGMGSLPEDLYFGVRLPGGMASGEDPTTKYEQGAALLKKLIDTAKTTS